MILAALVVLAAAPAPHARPLQRVAVIGVGDDAALAGDLQREVEQRLGAIPKVSVRGASEIASVLGASAPPDRADDAVANPEEAKQAAALLEAATQAYYEDRAAQALDKFGELGALYSRGNFPVSERVRLHLWRCAVFLSLQDEGQAENEALAALTLDPSSRISTKDFPPSVAGLLDKVRATRLTQATVIVAGLPPGAVITLDGRVVTTRIETPLGFHHLVASAPRRRDVARDFEVTADRSIVISLPIFLGDAVEKSLSDALWADRSGGGVPAQPDLDAVAAIAKRLGVERVVIAGHRGAASRAVVLVFGDGLSRVTAGDDVADAPGAAAAVAQWAERALREDLTKPLAMPAVNALAPRDSPPGWALGAHGGLASSVRSRKVGGLTTSFAGIGPAIGVDAARGGFVADAQAGFTTWGLSTLTVHRTGASDAKVGGGTSLRMRAAAGWRLGRVESAPSIALTAGLLYEAHDAEDLRDASGARVGLLTSYRRTAAELAFAARVPLGPGLARPSLRAGLAATPWSQWKESPAGALGTSPRPGVGAGASLALAFEPGARWAASVGYRGETRSVRFSGTGSASVDPDLREASLAETIHVFAIEARLAF